MTHQLILFGGTANPELAGRIASELGMPLGACEVERFPDGELTVRLLESVRDREVYVVQPTSPPVNDHLVELLAFADACRRSAAAKIIAVIPYFGYARADKRISRREPITASVVAAILEAVGITQVLTLDLHTPQIEGFFQIPVDTLTALPVLANALREDLPENAVIVSPDAGRVTLASRYASKLDRPVVVMHKQRTSGDSTRVTQIVGEVRDRRCVIVDDMISTGGTLVTTVEALREAGAHPDFIVVATHGLLLDGAVERLAERGVRAIYVTDSVPNSERGDPVRVVSVAPLLARAIRLFATDGSLEGLR